MKKFSIPCDFNGAKSPFTIFVGNPKSDRHPIHFQSDWLSKERQGSVPPEVMDSLSKLRDLAEKNGVSFEDLCVYAIGAAQEVRAEEEEAEAADGEESPEILDEDDESGGETGDATGDEAGDVDVAGDDSDLIEGDEVTRKKK